MIWSNYSKFHLWNFQQIQRLLDVFMCLSNEVQQNFFVFVYTFDIFKPFPNYTHSLLLL